MSNVLAIDTATTRTTVALIRDGELLMALHHDDPIAHGEVLPRLVAQLLEIENVIDEVVI